MAEALRKDIARWHAAPARARGLVPASDGGLVPAGAASAIPHSVRIDAATADYPDRADGTL